MFMFAPVNWDEELDTEAHLRAIPKEATIRGMFMEDVAKLAKKHSSRTVGRKLLVERGIFR